MHESQCRWLRVGFHVCCLPTKLGWELNANVDEIWWVGFVYVPTIQCYLISLVGAWKSSGHMVTTLHILKSIWNVVVWLFP